MDLKKVEERTIFLTQVGSHAYGTNLPSSDEDVGGVCIAEKQYYIGTKKFEQANKWVDADGNKIDKNIYSLDKALDLISENNPNMLDYLFIPERCVKKITKEWEKVLAVRDRFISKKCKHTFSGYAFAQLERIRTHRSYLMSPVRKPTRQEFGLPDKSIFPDTQVEVIAKLAFNYIDFNDKDSFYREVNQVVDNELMTIFRKYLAPEVVPFIMQEFKKGQNEYLRTFESIASMYLKDEYVGKAAQEMKYLTAYKNWKRYEDWKQSRNPKRQELEAKCGYDSKHASHLIRLQRMGIEILQGKGCRVDRTGIDADELIDIRLGNVAWDSILEMSRANQEKLDSMYAESTIPHQPDRNLIEKVKMEILEDYLFSK